MESKTTINKVTVESVRVIKLSKQSGISPGNVLRYLGESFGDDEAAKQVALSICFRYKVEIKSAAKILAGFVQKKNHQIEWLAIGRDRRLLREFRRFIELVLCTYRPDKMDIVQGLTNFDDAIFLAQHFGNELPEFVANLSENPQMIGLALGMTLESDMTLSYEIRLIRRLLKVLLPRIKESNTCSVDPFDYLSLQEYGRQGKVDYYQEHPELEEPD